MTGDLLLSTAIDEFIHARLSDGYSPGTLTQYKWGLELLLICINDKQVQSITLGNLRTYMGWLQTDYIPHRPGGDDSPLSGGSLFAAWKSVRALYLWLNTEYQVERIDLNWKRPKFEYPEIIPFTQAEVSRLLVGSELTREAHTRNRATFQMRRSTAIRDKALILLLLDTGLRVSEAARLKRQDINLEVGELHVQPFRTSRKSKPRTIPMGLKTVKAVYKYLNSRVSKDIKSDLVFLTYNHKPMNKDSIRQALESIAERADVPGCHPHRFRHTFAIQFLRNGGDIFTLQRLMGHSSLKMMQVYLAIAQSDIESAHRRASPVDNWF
jgi:integrase/recombinase XerD